jgi:hypothetical protein
MKNYTIGKTSLLLMIIVLGLQLETNAQNSVLSKIDGGASWSLEMNKPIDIANSSFSKTLDETNFTIVIIDATAVINLPDPADVTGRVYILVNNINSNHPIGIVSGTTVHLLGSTSPSTSLSVTAGTSMIIQSDGNTWYQIH